MSIRTKFIVSVSLVFITATGVGAYLLYMQQAEFGRLPHEMIAFGALIAVMLALILVLFRFQVERRLVQTAEAMRQLALNPTTRMRLPVSSLDEIGCMSHAFNQMADAVRESHDTLDQRIQQRTAELAHSESHSRAIIDSALDCVISIDHDGKVREWNPAAEKTFGYRWADVLDKYLAELIIPPPLREAHFKGLLQYLATGEGTVIGKRIEITGMRADGTEFPIEIAVEVVAREGLPVFVGYLRDLTERKRAEAALVRAKEAAEAANRAKCEFLANMSHEIRTPMNGVIGMTELVLETKLDSEQREYIEVVLQSAECLLRVINDLLDFAKIEAGKLSLEAMGFDLRNQLDDVIKPYVPLAEAKGLSLTYHVESTVPESLTGDPYRLRQILVNLIGNAIKFTERGGITVSVHLAEGPAERESETYHVRFSVKDTGIGIVPEKHQVIFHAFEQADTSHTRRYGGTGLGLAICSELVALMGGRIWVESEIDRGSVFHVELPFRAGSATAPTGSDSTLIVSPAKVTPTPSLGRSLQVLVVEDHPVNQRLFVRLLERARHHATVANNGKEAIALFRKSIFDVVLMDVQMPEMGGLEASAAIREIETERAVGRRTPIIAITAYAMREDQESCLKAGMDGYLSKPVHARDLLRTIETLVEAEETPLSQMVGRVHSPAPPCTYIGFESTHSRRKAASSPAPEPGTATSPDSAIVGVEILDEAALMERVDGDRDLLRELINLFSADQPGRFQEITTALEAGESTRLCRAAHAMKGAVANFCAREAAHEAKQLESLARDGNLGAAASACARLERALGRLEPELSRLALSSASQLADACQ